LAPVERCTNHTFEIADRLCGECGRPFCGMCLVQPFKRRPPLCHRCAVAAAGIRKSARTARVRSRTEIKAFERERRQDDLMPEAPTPPDGGFGPAKPAISAGSTRPPVRATAPAATANPEPKPQARPATADADEDAPQPVRNRPLRGLAR
jgi:hypothetical protein